MPELAWWQWAIGILCAFISGVAKSGMPGMGILVVPLMVHVAVDARHSSAWTLPILCTADLFALIAWRRKMAARKLLELIPWTIAGMILGAFALAWPDKILRPLIGCIVLAMIVIYLARRNWPERFSKPARSAPYGITAGFATTVANAAGPVMNLYLLSKKLSKEDFIVTGAWFFFVINLSKVPIYAYHGLFSSKSLTFNALVAPLVITGALCGKRLAIWIPANVFEVIVMSLTAASTVLLFF